MLEPFNYLMITINTFNDLNLIIFKFKKKVIILKYGTNVAEFLSFRYHRVINIT